MAVKVTLRKKKITKERYSLYLDFYPAIPHPVTGDATRREFLKMYIPQSPKSKNEEQAIADTLSIAENIRSKRENQLNKPEIYTEFEKRQLEIKAKGEQDFIQYFTKLAEKRKSSNHDNWMSALKYLISFTGGVLKFKD